MKTFKQFLTEDEEESYRGNHQPSKEVAAPLHDLTQIYPDDIYGPNGVRYYGDSSPHDDESFAIVFSAKGRPNKRVKIYRAVPNLNIDVDKEIQKLSSILNYRMKFNFFPVDNAIVAKKEIEFQDLSYDERMDAVRDSIVKDMEELKSRRNPNLNINAGDWVSINKGYAVEHGEATLRGEYKILSKTVPAKTLFTSGDSIHEWGYYPS